MTSFNIAVACVTELSRCDYCVEVEIRRTDPRFAVHSTTKKGLAMLNRRWIISLLASVGVICSIAAGTWYYQSRCHGMDACAAADAESHERDKPSEPQ